MIDSVIPGKKGFLQNSEKKNSVMASTFEVSELRRSFASICIEWIKIPCHIQGQLLVNQDRCHIYLNFSSPLKAPFYQKITETKVVEIAALCHYEPLDRRK